MKAVKMTLKIILCTIIVLILIVAAYVAYVMVNYNRIPDDTSLTVGFQPNPLSSGSPDPAAGKVLQIGTEYTALSFNIGFGAYEHDYSFFMDKGFLEDGTPVIGTESRALSKESAIRNTETVISQSMLEQTPDIISFQEVDVDADRSYSVNQVQMILTAFQSENMVPAGEESGPISENIAYWTYATNFHTAFLFYPPTKPIGFIKDAGLLTLSKYQIDSAVRRSYPVSTAFPTKFFDLDRCFSVNRLPVGSADDKGELVFINTHMSAYDEGGLIRKQQMELLSNVIEAEYQAGNWVIVSGDFNHALGGSETFFQNRMGTPPWVQPFDPEFVPEGFTMLLADNIHEVATDRDTSVPYVRGYNYEVVIDGFMVSDNVKGVSHNIDADYKASDHNPVLLRFVLE